MSGAENGAERPGNRVSGSGAVSGGARKRRSVSGARSGGLWSGSGAESGSNFPLIVRSNLMFLLHITSFIVTAQHNCERADRGQILRKSHLRMKEPMLIIKRTFIRSDCLESLTAFSGLTEPKKEQLQ